MKEKDRADFEKVMRDVASGAADRTAVASLLSKNKKKSPNSDSTGNSRSHAANNYFSSPTSSVAGDLQDFMVLQEEQQQKLAEAEILAAERQRKSLEIAELKAQTDAKRVELEERQLALKEEELLIQRAREQQNYELRQAELRNQSRMFGFFQKMAEKFDKSNNNDDDSNKK
jgi:hypothetical protein